NSAKHMERASGCTYKTAWRMAQLIRNELMEQSGEPIFDTVEADETYIGGFRRGIIGRGVDKAPVFGMVERKGRVVAVTVPSVKRATLMAHIPSRVLPASRFVFAKA